MLRLAGPGVKLLDDDAAAADALAGASMCFFVACFVSCFVDAAAVAGLDSDDRLESGVARGACCLSSPSEALISPHSGDDGRDGA